MSQRIHLAVSSISQQQTANVYSLTGNMSIFRVSLKDRSHTAGCRTMSSVKVTDDVVQCVKCE